MEPDDSLSCTDTIKRRRTLTFVYFFARLVAVFQTEFTKSLTYIPFLGRSFFTSEHEMKVSRIVTFFLL